MLVLDGKVVVVARINEADSYEIKEEGRLVKKKEEWLRRKMDKGLPSG